MFSQFVHKTKTVMIHNIVSAQHTTLGGFALIVSLVYVWCDLEMNYILLPQAMGLNDLIATIVGYFVTCVEVIIG